MKTLYFLIILCPFFAFAQNNYKPGYVVTLNGDTAKGYINYKDWNKNPKQIAFKNGSNSAAETYSVKNAASFSVIGYELYKRYTGKISEDPIELNYLPRGIDTTYKMDTVFLRVITSGKNVTLYEYDDVLKVRYFISSDTGAAVELSYHVFFDLNDNTKVAKTRGYMQQLQSLAGFYQSQNSKLAEEISTADYNADVLKKIAIEINGSDNSPVLSSEGHGGTRFFVGIGANYTSVKFVGNNIFSSFPASTSILPELNIGTDIFFNKEVGNFLIRLNLSASGDKVSYNAPSSSGNSSITVFTFNQYFIAFAPQLLYNVCNTDAFKFYIAAGGAANFAKYNNLQYYITNNISTTPYTNNLQTSTPINPHNLFFTPTAKIGIVLSSKLDIFVAYFPSSAIYSSVPFSINSTAYHAGINYLFGK